MKLAGFLLLLAGWVIVVGAVALLSVAHLRTVFILLGVGVEAMGLTFFIRSHHLRHEGKE